MSRTVKLQQAFKKEGADEALVDLIPALEALLPPGVKFDMDVWDLFLWKTRKGNSKCSNVFFSQIKNEQLKILIKIYFLEKRQKVLISESSIHPQLRALCFLDQALGSMNINKISNAIFNAAEDLIVINSSNPATAARNADCLERFGRWLLENFGYRICYSRTVKSKYLHGRKASDQDRDNKLIDFSIIADLIACLHREDLGLKDRFYILTLVLFIGTGFRINELATLPKDCLIQESEKLYIKYFPEKNGKLAVKPIMPKFAASVQDAVIKLTELTNQGREIVANLRKNPGLDWTSIMKDELAAQYFTGKFCHEWTSNPKNYIFNKEGAWYEKKKEYVDVIGLVEKAGSKSQAASEYGISRMVIDYLLMAQIAARRDMLPTKARRNGKIERTNWDTDSRVISIVQLENHINIKLKPKSRKHVQYIIEDARDNFQLSGKFYPCPNPNSKFEQQFKRVIHPVISSKKGAPILQPEDTLLITLTYQLSEHWNTKTNDYSLISDQEISHWLCGQARSLGTKNHEDSCFSRLGIIDPKTDEIATFVSHDIRHWFTTYLEEGGMSEDQIGLYLNRSPSQNSTYDQTSSKTRLNNMRKAIRDGGAMGHIADTYHNIAEDSREEAEQYLAATTLQLNLMPHGGCSLNWGMKACQNHNACFNSENGVCENLCVDLENQDTKIELHRMMRETKTALSVIPEQSPQQNHYQNIQRNLHKLCGVSE